MGNRCLSGGKLKAYRKEDCLGYLSPKTQISIQSYGGKTRGEQFARDRGTGVTPWGSGPPVSLWRAAHLIAQAPASAGPPAPEKSARPGQRLFHSRQAVPDQAGTRGGPRGAAGRRGEHCLATGPRRGLAETALVAPQAWVQDRRKTSGRAPSLPSLARVPGGLCRIRAALASPSVPWESAFSWRPRPPSLLPHRLLPPCPHPSPTRRPIT